jgi:Domain of unknown function (DUF5076)
MAVANELPIPPEALASRSVEMIRVWLANERQHIVLNIGFWEERGIDERAAWGIVLADMVHHIANAHEAEYGHEPQESIAKIRAAFDAEMEAATSVRLGEFVNEHREESS